MYARRPDWAPSRPSRRASWPARGKRSERSDMAGTQEGLSERLEELSEVERFEPPEEFREHAVVRDRSVYDEAAEDRLGWWEKQADRLEWFERWDKVLDDSD